MDNDDISRNFSFRISQQQAEKTNLTFAAPAETESGYCRTGGVILDCSGRLQGTGCWTGRTGHIWSYGAKEPVGEPPRQLEAHVRSGAADRSQSPLEPNGNRVIAAKLSHHSILNII